VRLPMPNYQLYGFVHKQEDLVKKNSLNLSLVDLLLDKRSGCLIHAVIEPRDKFEQEEYKSGYLIRTEFALNYGYTAFSFYVLIHSPDSIRSKGKDGALYILDNAEKNKTFFTMKDYNKKHWFSDADKVSQRFTLAGGLNKVFDDFKKKGYVFSDKPFQLKFGQEREEQLERAFKRYNIYNPKYNPAGRR